jgi:hypothetical protein
MRLANRADDGAVALRLVHRASKTAVNSSSDVEVKHGR